MRSAGMLIGYRVFFALLGFAAIVTEIATIVERNRFVPERFFSYFTIQSNSFAVAVLLLSALALAGGREHRLVSLLRGASTLYMAVVGMVFPLLLAGLDVPLTAVPWDNVVLHYLMPGAVVVDWFIATPRVRISPRQALVWLVFPLVYVVYSLVRGSLVNWYPYPFLDPENKGYVGVGVVTVGIALGSTALLWLLTAFTGRGTPATTMR